MWGACAVALAVLSAVGGGSGALGAALEPVGDAAFSGKRVSSIAIEVASSEDRAELLRLSGLREGQLYSSAAIRRAVKLLYQLGRFENVFVRAAETDGGVALELVLPPKPHVQKIRILGETTLTETEVQEAMGLVPGDHLDVRSLPALRQKLRETLLARGFRRAALGIALQAMDRSGGMDLLLRVDDGPKTRLRRLGLKGELRYPRPWIVQRLGLSPGDPLDLRAIPAMVERLEADYRRRGHWDVAVSGPEVVEYPDVSGDAPVADLVFRIEAGPKLRVRFLGNRVVPERQLRSDAQLMHALGSGPPELAEVRERILGRYERRGFWKAEVRAMVRSSPDRTERVVIFRIQEGTRPRVARCLFPGNTVFRERDLWEQVLLALERTLGSELERPGADPEVLGEILGDHSSPGERDSEQPYNTSPDPNRYEPFFQNPRPRIYVARAYRAAADAIADLYRSKGYQTVEVSPPEATPRKDGRLLDVRIRIQPGIPWRIGKLSFGGNEAIASGVLGGVSKLDPAREGGEPLSFYTVEEARRSVMAHYRNQGYLYATVAEEVLAAPDEVPELKSPQGLDTPDERIPVREACRRAEIRGRPECVVELHFRINQGPLVRTRRIILRGFARTNDKIVREAVSIREGEILTEKDMVKTRAELLRLGVFERVSVAPLDQDEIASQKDVLIEGKERKHLSFEVGLGASTEQGLRVFAGFGHANLFGRAIRLQASTKLSYLPDPFFVFFNEELRGNVETFYKSFGTLDRIEREFAVGLTFPRVFGLPPGYSAGMNVSVVRDNDPDFSLDSRKISLTGNYKGFKPGVFGQPRPLAIQLRTEFDWSDLKCNVLTSSRVGQGNQCIGDDQEGTNVYLSAGPRVSWDLRDRALDPRAGVYAELGGSYAKGLDNNSPDHVDVQGQVNVYVPLSRGGTGLALALIGHRVVLLEDGGAPIPRNRRAFVGGHSTVRGYAERSIFPRDGDLEGEGTLLSQGGALSVAVKTELRLPVFGALSLAGFFDVGELFENASAFALHRDYAAGAGLGVRYATPVGPLSIDFAVPLNGDRGIPQQIHFSVRSF